MSTARDFGHSGTAPIGTGPWLGRPAMNLLARNVREAWRRSLPLMAIVALRVAPGPQKILAYVTSMFYALMGRRQAIMALVMLWLCNMFTHAFGFPPSAAAIFRHLTVFAAAASVFLIHSAEPPRSRTPLLLAWTGVLSTLLILHSIFVSTMPDVSALKAISFAMTVQLLLTAWSRLSPQQRSIAEKQLFGVLYGLAILSAPLVAMGAGYVRSGRGFQGLLEHPQAFGPAMAIVAVWLFATWLTDRRMNLVLKSLLALSLAWVYFSSARIGVVMFLVGTFAAIVAGPFSSILNQSKRVPRILKTRLTLLVTCVCLTATILGPYLAETVQKFIAKGRGTTDIAEAAWDSRGGLIELMQENIANRPMTGLGLGVASTPEGYSSFVRDPLFGLVIMAAVEKGVLPVAIVEELGWPLALLYAPWFAGLLLMAIRAGPRYAGICAACLAMNISEALFFSPGGGGLIVQILVTMAATAPPAREDPIVTQPAASGARSGNARFGAVIPASS